jgi:hypothetical protein
VVNSAGGNLLGVQQPRDSSDDIFERVSPGAKTQLGSRNLGGALLTPDGDLSDLRGLEHTFQESATVGLMGVCEQKSALEVNSPLGRKTDGKIHGILVVS